MNLRESRYNTLYELLNTKDIYIVPNQSFRNVTVNDSDYIILNNNLCPYNISKGINTLFSGGVLASIIPILGEASTTVVVDEVGNISNIADVYDFTTNKPLTSNGNQVRALIQTSESTEDGSLVNDSNLQATFVTINAGEVSTVKVTGRVFFYFPILNSLRNRPLSRFHDTSSNSVSGGSISTDNLTIEEVAGVIRIKGSDTAPEGGIYQKKNNQFVFDPVVDGGQFE